MDNEYDQTTEAMMDVGEDSGIASNDSNSPRDSLASLASMGSSATSRNDSAIGSVSDRRSSNSSNVSSTSDRSDLSRSSRSSGRSSAGYSNSVSSSRRPSTSSVQSDDSATTIRSNATVTSRKSERNRTPTTSVADHQQSSGHATGTYSKSGYTKVGTHIPTTNTQPTAELTQIQVVDFAGKTHIVRVRPTDKVKDLKVKVQEKLKIAPSQQRLQFQGKMLDDKSPSSVKSLGLQNLSTVHLQGRLQGGALFSTA
ncbi:dentin sialophosphoprotein [Strongylocentrotus purpuratus]|uniref:Ubiquitin-like domain-containing protein n=1 Tax=Strongylocentrotus purpuratus TaxID=7668 RepID=A0A7M7LLK3_STRPU|nr:dentin sialophosphoprotein [Strongylocentrotus purpuratus]